MKYLAPAQRSLPEAIALGKQLALEARQDREVWLAASIVRGPAVALGRFQRAGRVLNLAQCAAQRLAVFRRATSGTAAFVAQDALLWTLALPHVNALCDDAQRATLLNRNVRGFLQGLTRAGAVAHYFGREWIAVRHRPAALLGYHVDPDGVVLLDVIAPWQQSLAFPRALVTDSEANFDHWNGKTPGALADLLPANPSLESVSATVSAQCASRWKVALEETPAPPVGEVPRAITDALDPLDASATLGPIVPAAIGHVEAAARGDGTMWLGGDFLAGQYELDELCLRLTRDGGAAVSDDLGIQGARAAECWKAWSGVPRGN